MPETFRFGEIDLEYDHRVGDPACDIGWCNAGSFPIPCKCGGLIHANFGDESRDGYWLYRECDQCGSDYEEDV